MEPSSRRSAGRLMLVAAILASCRAPETIDPVTGQFPEARAEVEQALRDLLSAAERKDFPALESLHLEGPKFSKWEGKDRLDAEGNRRAERAGIEPLDAFRPAVEDLKVDVFGGTAVATVEPIPVVLLASAGCKAANAASRLLGDILRYIADVGAPCLATFRSASGRRIPTVIDSSPCPARSSRRDGRRGRGSGRH